METQGGSSSGSMSTMVVSCKHNHPCAINTSWTGRNPGRKFYCCRHWKDNNNDCGFFKWVDAVSSGEDEIITQLKMDKWSLEKKVELENKVGDLKAKSRRRKEQLNINHQRMANVIDECVELVAEVRKVRGVLSSLERYVANNILLLIVLIASFMYSFIAAR